MKIIEDKQEMYVGWKAKNDDDGYGKACFDFAEQWATLMEEKLAAGATIAEVAEACMAEVNNRPGFGITGYMYGMAVSILAKAWVHGEELRRWHNRDVGGEEAGEKANKSGGVINPAILVIGTPTH